MNPKKLLPFALIPLTELSAQNTITPDIGIFSTSTQWCDAPLHFLEFLK
ncbi:hypothetical protein [uncultured Proteiniphilum sp.]|nr:hypothetical protein [uncultured Proteiniphilum sp.]